MTKKKNEKANNHVCPHRFAFMLDNWFRKLIQPPGKILKEYIKSGDRVIDLGCGPGFFTIEMAKMVGPSGRVLAVDLQPEMLAKVKKKAERKGVGDRIETHQSNSDSLGLGPIEKVRLVLAYYMIHETNNPRQFLKDIKEVLAPGGEILLVEPKMHVDEKKFKNLVDQAGEMGYKILDYPSKKGGRAVVLSH